MAEQTVGDKRREHKKLSTAALFLVAANHLVSAAACAGDGRLGDAAFELVAGQRGMAGCAEALTGSYVPLDMCLDEALSGARDRISEQARLLASAALALAGTG